MKKFAGLLVLVCVIVIVSAKPQDKYTTKYDHVDVDNIIKNERILKNYVNCLLDQGKCNPDGMELKRVLPDALLNKCSKCSEAQRTGSRKIVNHLIKNKRQWWDELEAKYDKNGVYRKQYEAEAKKEGINL